MLCFMNGHGHEQNHSHFFYASAPSQTSTMPCHATFSFHSSHLFSRSGLRRNSSLDGARAPLNSKKMNAHMKWQNPNLLWCRIEIQQIQSELVFINGPWPEVFWYPIFPNEWWQDDLARRAKGLWLLGSLIPILTIKLNFNGKVLGSLIPTCKTGENRSLFNSSLFPM